MTRDARLRRLIRDIDRLDPDHDVVIEAMDQFRSTGRLPRDVRLANAVAAWASTGAAPLGPLQGLSFEQLSVHVVPQHGTPSMTDRVMLGIYEDAIFGDYPEHDLARVMLAALAMAGLDPSEPLWRKHGWPAPTKTCNSMALSILGFPVSFVLPVRRRRAGTLNGWILDYADENLVRRPQVEAMLDATSRFALEGDPPREGAMRDAVLWNVELQAYVDEWLLGQNWTRLIAALRTFWGARADKRVEALSGVSAAMVAGPESVDPKHPGIRARLKSVLLPFAIGVMSAAEQLS